MNAFALHERAMALRDAGKVHAARTTSARAVLAFEAEEGPRSPDLANALVEHAGAAHDAGDYDAALAAARRALRVLGRRKGDLDWARVRASAEQQVASTLVAQGAYRAALAPARRALAIARALPSVERASHLNMVGVVCKYTERFAEGARVYGRALRILEKAFGPRAEALAPILHNLGGLAHAQGRFAAAEPLARRGLAIRRRV